MSNEDNVNDNDLNVPAEVISGPMDLLHKLGEAEEEYRKEEFKYNKQYNTWLLTTDWNELNKERVEDGLPKLSNAAMKEAYIKDRLKLFEEDLVASKLKYYRLYRMYEMMRKYSLDVLR